MMRNRVFSFDPDAHLAAASPALEPTQLPIAPALPEEWRVGLARLEEMPPPHGATPERWEQIVRDTIRFCWWDFADALAAGWTAGNIFGFEYNQPDRLVGLVFDIRGGRVLTINQRWAAIRRRDGGHFYHYRRMPDDARPIWRIWDGGRR